MAERMAEIVTELIFFLIAQDGKRGDSGSEGIVTVRVKTGDSLIRDAKGKLQGEAKIIVARFRVVQTAGAEAEAANPGRREGELVVERKI